jgi:hypothetical protein
MLKKVQYCALATSGLASKLDLDLLFVQDLVSHVLCSEVAIFVKTALAGSLHPEDNGSYGVMVSTSDSELSTFRRSLFDPG